MASTSKCPYCDSTVRSDQERCPGCGAPNALYVVDTPRTVFQPKTIEELQEYCAERGMPLLRMRFFIGEDCREPKAFGIYRDGKNVVVYKNKSDGSRAVRYQGPDEARGVRELYEKLLQECHNRGIYPDGKPTAPSKGQRGVNPTVRRRSRISPVFLAFLLIVFLTIAANSCSHIDDGYYRIADDNRIYYNYGSDWFYALEDAEDNIWYEADGAPAEDYTEYQLGEDWDADWGVGDFKESDAWDSLDADSGGSFFDSDDGGWDSWDSGGTDWDSDW